jgi:NodT family efflux transporter outer membrane factor (OMF) lipoprotein
MNPANTQSSGLKSRSLGLSVLLCGAVGACMVGPSYHRPSVATPPAFKETEGWAPVQPSDAADRKDWWTVFGDPVLDNLEARVNISNQTLKADEAAYRQAHALVAEDRAALFPTIALNASDTASKSAAGTAVVGSGVTASAGGGRVITTYEPSIGGTWAPDIWGAVRRQIQNAAASAQAGAATLANARLSAQTELAADYISLRQLDEEKRILDDTVTAYQRSLAITENKYKVGVAAQSDVLSARGQLLTTQASDTDLAQQRARMEHAIAILTGAPPADLPLPTGPWSLRLPQIPTSVPSALLQRRPDISSAERSADAANALIGVQVAAYFPNITLTGTGGFASSELGNLFNVSNSFWSVGASAAETIFDAGARAARVRGARAAYDEAVANYRQTVLTAFGQVEDNLAAQRVFGPEEAQLRSAADVTAANEKITLNEYKAGTVDYTTVVTAEAAALSSRNALLTVQASRLTTAVDLIEALGGGWTTADLPKD